MSKLFNIEVAYALPHKQWLIKVLVEEGCTIQAAIMQSGILALLPEMNLESQAVGIFGKKRLLSDLVEDGDRIEIYRPLLIDPKDARRAKAKKKLA
jgi:putative ubiquitin-RnfH superfamily antitoxin RatB of RatAB toxin-antitoxin module